MTTAPSAVAAGAPTTATPSTTATPTTTAAPAKPTVSVTISPIDLAGPAIAEVTVTVFNRSSATLSNLTVAFAAPIGWSVNPATQKVRGALRPGRGTEVTLQVRIPAPRSGFRIRTFTSSASYRGGDGLGAAVAEVNTRTGEPLATLAAAFGNVGVTSEKAVTDGDFDGEGNSFSAEKLAAAGVVAGKTVTYDGATFSWPSAAPGTANNAASAGQAISLSGRGSRVAFLGSGSNQGATGAVTVFYTDGSTSTGTIGFPNWSFQAADAFGATLAVATKGRNTPDGYANAEYDYRLFTHSVPLTAGKTVDLVVLPANSALHVFALSIV